MKEHEEKEGKKWYEENEDHKRVIEVKDMRARQWYIEEHLKGEVGLLNDISNS